MKKKDIRGLSIHRFMSLGIALTFAVFIAGNAGAEPATVADIVAESGCAMAHCNQGMTDNTGLSAALSGGVVDFWRDRTVNGTLAGLGCVANSNMAVCSFRSSSSKPVEIRAYRIDGTPLWSSTELSSKAYYSAPVIGPDGGVIAADETKIIRFKPDGDKVWSRATAGGDPISPNVTDDGHIILATKGGPVSAYDFDSGQLIAQLRLNATVRVGRRMLSGIFDTINTPAIKGNRIYISTRFSSGRTTTTNGRLYALDLVQNDSGYSLKIAWYHEFRAPSGTSPTLSRDAEGNTIINFDGSGETPASADNPMAMGVRDLGTSGELLWSYPLSAGAQTSPALDPRGGVWYNTPGSSELVRINNRGDNIQTIDVNTLINNNTATFNPFAIMTISENARSGNPVMIVQATNPPDYSIAYVIAIDLAAGSLLWQYRVDEGKGFSGGAAGQYAMLINNQDEPVLVFSTRQNGVWGLVVGPQAEPGR